MLGRQVFTDLDVNFTIGGGQRGLSGCPQGFRVELETLRGLLKKSDVSVCVEKLDVTDVSVVEPDDAFIVPE